MSHVQYIFTKRLLTKQMNNLRNHKLQIMLFCCRNAVRSANMTHSVGGRVAEVIRKIPGMKLILTLEDCKFPVKVCRFCWKTLKEALLFSTKHQHLCNLQVGQMNVVNRAKANGKAFLVLVAKCLQTEKSAGSSLHIG